VLSHTHTHTHTHVRGTCARPAPRVRVSRRRRIVGAVALRATLRVFNDASSGRGGGNFVRIWRRQRPAGRLAQKYLKLVPRTVSRVRRNLVPRGFSSNAPPHRAPPRQPLTPAQKPCGPGRDSG